MARYVQDVVLNKPDNFVFFIMNDFLQKNGFTLSDWRGEPAYRAGDPLLTGYRFLKYSYTNGVFHLEAWMMGTFGGEWNLEGFVAAAQKGPYKNNLQMLISTLQQPLPQQQTGAPAGTFSQPSDAQASNTQTTGAPNMGGPVPASIPVQTVDNHNAAVLALVFGILSIVFFCIPLFSLIFAALGFSQARMGECSSKAHLARAGKICSIIGLVFAACMFVLNIGSSFLSILLEALA